MKRIKITTLVLLLAAVGCTFKTVSAQSDADKGKAKKDAKEITKFAANKILGDNDLSFIDMLTVKDAAVSRGKGEAKTEVTLKGKTFKAGEKLSEADAATINKAIAEYNKTHKPAKAEGKSRGAGDCYYYCYYDYYGNYICYWYCD